MENVSFRGVISSQINSIGYKEETSTLYVMFKNNGKVYSYSPVSLETYDELMKAKSVGSYFHKNIRKKSNIKATREG